MLAANTSQHLAHQFDTVEQQQLSVRLCMWAFIATEVMFFGGMFAGYAAYRMWYPDAWEAGSRHLSRIAGTTNTFVLLSSSLTMALAVSAAAGRSRQGVQRYLLVTLLLGVLFLGIKFYEYLQKWQEHLIPGHGFRFESSNAPATELFFSFYFVMTGWHAVHMLIGLGLLTWLLVLAIRCWRYENLTTRVETVGLYWHFVDIVWVFLFPLLYLVSRS